MRILTRPLMQGSGLIVFLMMFTLAPILEARLTKSWTYKEMFDKSDLVVIAKFISTKDTNEHTTLQDLTPPINVAGVVTEFKSSLILKGARDITTFQLHHYRLQSKDDLMIENGPALIRFAARHSTYLLFLTKKEDGRYVPVTGQTDPAGLSVVELVGGGD